jgi:magnesium-transporting ATPase (P-type)
LVVGDVVLLNQGDRVPADGILLEESDIRIDQRFLFCNPDVSDADVT